MIISCPYCYQEFGLRKKRKITSRGSLEDVKLVKSTLEKIKKGEQTQICKN